MKEEIVIKEDPNLISELTSRQLTPEMLRALNSLYTGRPPVEAVKTHPGKGGKIFSYVSHVYATRLMNSAMRFLWEFKVINYEAFDDGSAVALCNLKIFIPMTSLDPNEKREEFVVREFQEIGAWESARVSAAKAPTIIKDNPEEAIPLKESTPEEKASREYGMTKAMIIASAASRGLLRCMMRAFNFGSEFYESEESMTNIDAWKQIKIYAEGRGLAEKDLIELVKGKFKRDELADRFQEMFTYVYNYIEEKRGIPDDIK